MTWHFAFIPQVPGQGSIHFRFEQDSLRSQSELTVHSGLQEGGVPKNPSKHEQTACLLYSLQRLFGPHGDGLHGLTLTISTGLQSVNAFPVIPEGQLHTGI